MIIIEFEVIVKYNGDILRLENELGVGVEILSPIYAIVTSNDEDKLENLINYKEIEYIEKPFILNTQDTQSFSSTGITSFKNRTNLTGEGTIIGIIDSGIDYTLDVFKDDFGKSKILYYWDQSMNNNPPQGFKEGTLYTNEDINKAIKGEVFIPVSITATHGTHVASICSQIANKAKLIVVRVGSRQTDTFSRSTEFMRAIKFILDKSIELNMPVSINISYGSNEGSHRGLSLFEQYIDDMCIYWKNNIVVAAGNNANKGAHKLINLKDDEIQEVEFVVGENETILNVNIWPNFTDLFEVYLVSPSNETSQILSKDNNTIKSRISTTDVTGVFYDIAPYSLKRRISIELKSKSSIQSGTWKIVFNPIEIVSGFINIYLPTSEGISKDTKFLDPDSTLTVTVPGSAKNVITVGSFNSRTGNVSVFSGEGDTKTCILKPDIVAPGEDIVSFLPGGSFGALTGTSMATPHVTGACCLLMQWGIVNKNDLFLYSQKLKSLLLSVAKRDENLIYPNDFYGYGKLNLSDLIIDEFIEDVEEFDFFRGNRNTKDLKIVINVFHTNDFYDELQKSGIVYEAINLSENFSVLIVNNEDYRDINKLFSFKSTIKIDNNITMNLLSEVSGGTTGGVVETESIGANFFKNNPNIELTGKGIIIAVCDSGIDYLHEDFIYPDGTSKILYLWDQTKEGSPPEGYFIGTEYTNEDINNAIKEKNKELSTDEVGSGTLISGICAGLGNINKEYEGIAKDADLIVVKLAKINGNYNNATLLMANEYVNKKAKQLNRPICINISLGSNNLAGLEESILYKRNLFEKGIFACAGVGNDGNLQLHTSGNTPFLGEEKEIELEIEEDQDKVEIQLWVDRPYKVNIIVQSPSGEDSSLFMASNYDEIEGIFDLENTEYIISYVYPTTYSGQQFISIVFTNIKKGIWKIKLIGVYKATSKYNMYIINTNNIDKVKFRESSPFYTVNYPGVSRYLTTVGVYNTLNNSLWSQSSRGPNINNKLKPDIVAPGVNIISTYPDNKYAKITGSAAAVAHVTGAAAIYLQYVNFSNLYENKDYPQDIKTYMQLGARRDSNLKYPNENFGYGILDIRGLFNAFR